VKRRLEILTILNSTISTTAESCNKISDKHMNVYNRPTSFERVKKYFETRIRKYILLKLYKILSKLWLCIGTELMGKNDTRRKKTAYIPFLRLH
jgi:hypothetical protein